MIGIDTNVLLRYMRQDDALQSPLATRFIETQLSSARPGHVSLVALAELLWVLGSRFGATVAQQVDTVTALLGDPRFVVQDDSAVWLALEACEAGAGDLADALIACLDRTHGCSHTVTFDRGARALPGMTLLQ